MPPATEQEELEWRCECAIRPKFGVLRTRDSTVHVKVSGRRSFNLHYVFFMDREVPALVVHCPACHRWRVLAYEGGNLIEAQWRPGSGSPPTDIRCSCTARG